MSIEINSRYLGILIFIFLTFYIFRENSSVVRKEEPTAFYSITASDFIDKEVNVNYDLAIAYLREKKPKTKISEHPFIFEFGGFYKQIYKHFFDVNMDTVSRYENQHFDHLLSNLEKVILKEHGESTFELLSQKAKEFPFNGESDSFLCFSRPYHNFLYVEVRSNDSKRYSGMADCYLFILNKSDSIDVVFEDVVHYM